MSRGVIIADDLTGANATGVLIKKKGYKTYTMLEYEQVSDTIQMDCDCVIYTTDSRAISKEEAYKRVYGLASQLKQDEIQLYAKRIDSTLRGNLAVEVDALLDTLGDKHIAVVVPCFPTAHRAVVGGYLLVHNVLLNETEVAKDPKNPIHTAQVRQFFEKDSKYKVASLHMKNLMQGKGRVSDLVKQLVQDDVRIIICDACTQEHIDEIAEAMLETQIPFIPVDPGVFTASVVEKIMDKKVEPSKNCVLVAVGSVNPVTKEQVEYFYTQQEGLHVFIETGKLLESKETCQIEVQRVIDEVLSNKGKYSVYSIVGDGIYEANRLDLRKRYTSKEIEQNSIIINQVIAEIVYKIMVKDKRFQGIYTSGGDITVAVCGKMQVTGIELIDEVLPLAAYGKLRGGIFDGLRIVTKGGMVGSQDALVKCVQYLQDEINKKGEL